MATFFLRQPLYGVTQHRAGHFCRVAVKERGQLGLAAPFADFPEHPSRGLVDKVMTMGQELSGKPQGVLEITLTDKAPAGNHGDALMP